MSSFFHAFTRSCIHVTYMQREVDDTVRIISGILNAAAILYATPILSTLEECCSYTEHT
jgi:hypothetical protein